jgi:hypothetical protein
MDLKTRLAGGVLTGLVVAVAGCGGAPPPTTTQAEAIAAVRAAEEVGAEQSPQAALHLQLASEQMQRAERLMADGKMEEARRVLDRARADAELAIALSRETQAQSQAAETRSHIESLRQGQL